MRVPLSWLRDYVDVALAPDELAEQLTLRGMEVQAVELGGDIRGVVVGRLLAVERHPNAEKLSLTRVEVGAAEVLEIVCGATNIAPGQLVPVALPGAELPGGRRIERSRIRGVSSAGMLCSAAELGLGSDADGIHLLGAGDEYPLGSDLRLIVGEAVLDVDVKPNRGDALSMVGLAREIAAFSRGALRLPAASVEERGDPAAQFVSVRIDEPALCPRFTARYLDTVANGPAPDWMQRRLLAAGIRPVSATVDVTNYVMHELGQPLHAYDADAVPDGMLVVRRARAGEQLETIDHVARTLTPSVLVIADRERAIGLAGVMGGADTEVTHATQRVILESAIFHGPTIRNAARRLGLRSEASARHEKGVWWSLPRLAADRAARLMTEICGARVARGIIDNDPEPKPRRTVTVSVPRLERLLGIPLTGAQVGELLRPLEFASREDGAAELQVTVPPHRLDVVEAADVAEEVARSYGYVAIAGKLPAGELPPHRHDPSALRQRVRRTLAGLGLDETVTHALIGPADLSRSGYDAHDAGLVRVANPLSDEHSVLRPVLYPSLLRSLRENVRMRRADPWIFELGKVYWLAASDRAAPAAAETAGTGRYETWLVGIGLLGPATPLGGGAPHDAGIADLKAVVEALHAHLGAPLPGYQPEPADGRHPHLHPGRAARLLDTGGRQYGSIGEVDPRVAAAWDLPGRPQLAAIDLGRLGALVPAAWRVEPIPAAQPIDRDLAVVLDDSTPVGELLRIVRRSAGSLLVDARLFDEYRGPQAGSGRVSYALRLRFQPLRAGEERAVEKALGRIGGALRHHLHAEIR